MQNLKEHKLLSGTYGPDPATEARQTQMRPRASLRLSDFSEQYLVDGEKPNASNAGTMDNWIPRMKVRHMFARTFLPHACVNATSTTPIHKTKKQSIILHKDRNA